MEILPEDLEARPIDCLLLTATSNCNLRCTYCGVSQPWYVGQDLDISNLDNFIAGISDYKTNLIQVNGHGETTMIEGWGKFCQKLLDKGFPLVITSNFARLCPTPCRNLLGSGAEDQAPAQPCRDQRFICLPTPRHTSRYRIRSLLAPAPFC